MGVLVVGLLAVAILLMWTITCLHYTIYWWDWVSENTRGLTELMLAIGVPAFVLIGVPIVLVSFLTGQI